MKILPRLNLRTRTHVMGILNVTPDSFSDGGRFFDKAAAVKHALAMVTDGADIIDIGGESTRPGADELSAGEELARVVPVILAIAKRTGTPISIDTRKAKVAEEAIRAGACIVNDVSGLRRDKNMASVAARYGVPLIIMHMKGTPKDMQAQARYKDVVKDIVKDLSLSINKARAAGVKDNDIIVDPGIGFGKTFKHNIEILNRLDEFKVLKLPICIGTSRKSFIGKALGLKDPSQRLSGTIATCVMAIIKGANIIRVHDVKEAAQAARITDIVLKTGNR